MLSHLQNIARLVIHLRSRQWTTSSQTIGSLLSHVSVRRNEHRFNNSGRGTDDMVANDRWIVQVDGPLASPCQSPDKVVAQRASLVFSSCSRCGFDCPSSQHRCPDMNRFSLFPKSHNVVDHLILLMDVLRRSIAGIAADIRLRYHPLKALPRAENDLG